MFEFRIIFRGDGRYLKEYNRYELLTEERPAPSWLHRVQRDLGFDPTAYGRPEAVVTEQRATHLFVTTWSSRCIRLERN